MPHTRVYQENTPHTRVYQENTPHTRVYQENTPHTRVMSLEEVLGNAQFWPLMLSLSVIPAVLQYLTLPFCPESPRYLLINRGQEEEAEADDFA
ncbi:UNVERIFIED_CONTAM: hypothetical protein FKN15_029781 [Acipenser sinensis]